MKWIALDTETCDGAAFLVTHAGGHAEISSFADFLRFLQTFSTDTAFVFYNLDYDVQALAKLIGPDAVKKLYLDQTISYKNVSLRYIKGKLFEIIGLNPEKIQCFDLCIFFQQSLDTVAHNFLGERKLELPGGLIENLTPEVFAANRSLIIDYAIRDAALTQKLLDKFVTSLKSAGLEARALYSPGYLAKRFLRKNRVRVPILAEKVDVFARNAYGGGRIEVAKRGYFPTIYAYDLTSAYPSAIAELPDLFGAHYRISCGAPKSEYYIARAKVTTVPGQYVYPFRWHNKALTYYPCLTNCEVVATSYEFEVARKWGAKIQFVESLNIYPKQTASPLQPIVTKLFARRGVDPMEKQVYKLILNSLYGVFAEKRSRYVPLFAHDAYRYSIHERKRIGLDQTVALLSRRCNEVHRYWEKNCACSACKTVRAIAYKRKFSQYKPPHIVRDDEHFFRRWETCGTSSHTVYAAFITAVCRARMYDAAMLAAGSYVASFTDCLVTSRPADFLDVPPEKTLGQWELDYTGPAVIVGSGIYQTDSKTKFRGFRGAGDLREILSKMNATTFPLDFVKRVTAGQFVVQHKIRFEDLNVISIGQKKFDLNFDRKRKWERPAINGGDLLVNMIESIPLQVSL